MEPEHYCSGSILVGLGVMWPGILPVANYSGKRVRTKETREYSSLW